MEMITPTIPDKDLTIMWPLLVTVSYKVERLFSISVMAIIADKPSIF
jgi:hypothetical protein